MTESTTFPPALTGVHHLKFPVHDLAASIAWFETALGAVRVVAQDHVDREGRLFAVILRVPGLGSPIELRHAPETARAAQGYDPVTFGVADRAALEAWVSHLDRAGVDHSPIINGFIGQMIEFRTIDGLSVRLYTDPVGGFDAVEMRPDLADLESPVNGLG